MRCRMARIGFHREVHVRVYVGLFAIALLAALSRAEPAVAQECDPDVCANPWSVAKARKHKQVAAKKRSATPKLKQEYLRY